MKTIHMFFLGVEVQLKSSFVDEASLIVAMACLLNHVASKK
jgi:hypothetical protein